MIPLEEPKKIKNIHLTGTEQIKHSFFAFDLWYAALGRCGEDGAPLCNHVQCVNSMWVYNQA